MMSRSKWQPTLSALAAAGLLFSSISPAIAVQPTASVGYPLAASASAGTGVKPDEANWVAPGFQSAQSLRQAAIDARLAQLSPINTDLAADLAAQGDAPVIVIFQFAEPDVVNYTGGVAGLAPTAAEATGKFNPQSPATQSYINYLLERQAAFAVEMAQVSPAAKVLLNYTAAMNGMAVKLPAADVAKVAALPGVVKVYENTINQLDTDVGPQWIGATSVWTALGGQQVSGEGIVVGIIDSGLWSPNPVVSPTLPYTMPIASFAGDASAYGGAYTFPFTSTLGHVYTDKLGVCASASPQPSDNTFVCTNKVIGGYWYNASGIANPGEVDSPLDEGGHGTHTASTAAGNRATAVNVTNDPIATVSGVAPRARIIAYKVCWDASPALSDDGGCGGVDSVAAINQGILDGVDVFNYSISGGSDPINDAVEQAFRSARTAGIFVSASAGNSGPTASTVAHLSPWLNTSAAMAHNRTFRSSLALTATNATTMPTNLNGASTTGAYTGTIILAPVQVGDGFYPSRCLTPYPANTFTNGEIVVCRRGVNARVEKAAFVAAGGAGGFVLVNAAANQGLSLDAYAIPGVHLEFNATSFSQPGEDLVNYLKAMEALSVTVTGTIGGGLPAAKQGDVMASFSSRGPNSNGTNLVKPDNAAPGVEILAAVSPWIWDNGFVDGQTYGFYNGTSMSSPHTAGAGALMKALRPTWTPAQIQSALMTGADPILKENGTTPTTPFDDGAGRINLTRAMMPGLVFNVANGDYTQWISGTRAIETLNIPSFAQYSCLVSCSWTRTGLNVYTATSTYTWSVVSASAGLVVSLNQPTYTVNAGGSLTFTVTADVSGMTIGQTGFARLVMQDSASGARISLPVVVVAAAAVLDDSVDVVTPRNSGGDTILGQVGSAISPTTATLYGVAARHSAPGTASGSDDQDWDTNPLNPAFGWFLYESIIPANTGRFVVTTSGSNVSDLDLAVLVDMNQNGTFEWPAERVATSASGSAAEKIDLINLQDYAGYPVMAAVYNWSGEANATFDLNWWVARPTVGTLSLSNFPGTLASGEYFTATLRFDREMMAGEMYYGLVNFGSTTSEDAIGSTLVNIQRIADEVSKSVWPTTASIGDVVTYTIVVKNQETVTRTFMLTDMLPANLTYVPGSLTGPATMSGTDTILLNTSIPGQVQAPNYTVVDSISDPSIIAQHPRDGFDDFAQYGAIAPRGDNLAFAFNNVGCAVMSYYGDPAVSGTNNLSLGFSTNGGVFPRSSTSSVVLTSAPLTAPLPTAALPNGFITGFGGDLSITNTVNITDAGRAAFSFGACGTDYAFGLQLNLHKKSDDTQKLKMQYFYDELQPDVHWLSFGDVSGAFTPSGGVSGAEDFAGANATAYTGVITNGLVLKYYRQLFAAPPVTVTFQATVTGPAPTIGWVLNTVDYTVDAPHTTAMEADAALYLNNYPQVTFVYHDLENVVWPGEAVLVAGSFNGWSNPGWMLDADVMGDVLSLTLPITPGGYQYKFQVYDNGMVNWDMLNTNDRTITVTADMTQVVHGYRNVMPGYQVLQSPATMTVWLNQPTPVVYGRVYVANVTNGAGAGRGIMAEAGYGMTSTLSAWNWVPMSYNAEDGNNDEYMTTLGTMNMTGVYSYAVRFNGNWGAGNPNSYWAYGDLDGVSPSDPTFELDQAGVMTVLARLFGPIISR